MIKWFNKNYSKNIIFPNIKEDYVNNYFKEHGLNNNSKYYKSKNTSNITNYISNIKTENVWNVLENNKKFEIKIKKITNNNKLNDKEKNTKIKTANTKYEKQKINYNTVTKNESILCYPNYEQKKILFQWFAECDNVYNTCVDEYNDYIKGNIDDNPYYYETYQQRKIHIFKKLYGNNKKQAPYDVLTDEVRIFYSNLKSCETNLRNHNIKHFRMTYKNTTKNRCILIPKKAIYKNGFFKTMLGDININDINLCHQKVTSDSRLNYDKIKRRFVILIPRQHAIKKITNREKIVALDPGEKIHNAFYGLQSYGYLGKDMRKPILNIEKKIRKTQRILSQDKNIKGEKLKNKNKMKKKINKYYDNIKNKVKDLHNKEALFLCTNYDKILIPEFKTKQMVKNDMKKQIKKTVREIHESSKTKEELKEKIKTYRKRKQLNGRVKFVLNMLSHYKFRQHLLNKGKEYGCEVIIVTEEYTSKTCTYCGEISDEYDRRTKICSICNKTINRDINGARNILLKYLMEHCCGFL